MRYKGLKRLLLEVTFIFTLSIISFGCSLNTASKSVTIVDFKKDRASDFDPAYYVSKKPEMEDIKILQDVSKSSDKTNSAAASLILGYYKMVLGSLDEGDELIRKYYANYYLPSYMRVIGKLWRMESSLYTGKYINATIWADTVERQKDEAPSIVALEYYCASQAMTYENDPYSCVERRLEDALPEDSGEYVYDGYIDYESNLLEGDLNILVTSKKTQDASGVFYYIKKEELPHKIRISKNYKPGDWDFIIDLDTGHLAGRGYGIYFAPDLSINIKYINDYINLNACEKILFGYTTEYKEEFLELIGQLTDLGLETGSVNIAENTAGSTRKILTNWDKDRFCAVAAGSEEEINNFVPIVRQYITNTDIQFLYILTKSDTGVHYTNQYINYYKNSYVFPVVDLYLSPEAKAFYNEFYEFNGSSINLPIALGYDMMHFIDKLTVSGNSNNSSFITNVLFFNGDKAIRPIKGYYINKKGRAEYLDLEISQVDLLDLEQKGSLGFEDQSEELYSRDEQGLIDKFLTVPEESEIEDAVPVYLEDEDNSQELD